jgi:hypothetical protein
MGEKLKQEEFPQRLKIDYVKEGGGGGDDEERM